MKALKVTISGSYLNGKREIVDFENVVGVVPATDYDVAVMHIRNRFANPWISSAVDKNGKKIYEDRVELIRQVFIDNVEEVEHDFSFFGKNIKEMTDEELQDLSVFKDLRRVPLPKRVSGTDIREARTVAYCEYSDNTLGTDLIRKKDQPEFDFANMPPLVVTGTSKRDATVKLTNDEVLEQEQKKMGIKATPKSNMTLDELRRIAKEKNIAYSQTTGFDDLYAKIFGV